MNNFLPLVSSMPSLTMPIPVRPVPIVESSLVAGPDLDLGDLDLDLSSFPWTIAFSVSDALHRGFLEHWNSQKRVSNIWQRFSCLFDEWIENIRNFFSTVFFFEIHFIWDAHGQAGQIWKYFLGYNINYLSILPFMCHS